MRESELKIGAKSKSKRPQIVAKYNRPENVADIMQICHNNEAVVAALANRGLTIFLQDRIGRPMFEAGDSQEAIQSAILACVPGKTKGVSRKVQKVVPVQQGKTYSAAEIQQLLLQHGIKTVESK